MFKNIKQRLDNFFRADLRWKLIKLSKYTKVNFYPIFFSRKGGLVGSGVFAATVPSQMCNAIEAKMN